MRYSGVLLLLVISLFFAGRAQAENIGFSEDMAKRLVVELEVCRTLQEQTQLYKESNEELERQVSLLEKVVELQRQEIEMSQTVIKNQKEMMSQQADAYEKTLKASKPNPFRRLIDTLGFVGVGVLAGALLL